MDTARCCAKVNNGHILYAKFIQKIGFLLTFCGWENSTVPDPGVTEIYSCSDDNKQETVLKGYKFCGR